MLKYNIIHRTEQKNAGKSLRPRHALLAMTLFVLAGCAEANEKIVISQPMNQKITVDPAVMALAERAVDQDRFDDARKMLQRVLFNDPQNTHAALLWAEIMVATGQASAASSRFDPIIKDKQFQARALQGKGLALLWTGEPEVASELLKRAVEQDPKLWRAWNALGYYYDTVDEWSLAGAAYSKALALKPRSAMIHNNRGYSLLLQRRVDAAIDDLSKAVRLDPKLEIAQLNLRIAMAWSGLYQRAVLGASKKDLPRALNNAGFVALLRGDYVAAEALLLRAVQSDATYNNRAYRNLAYMESLKKIEQLGSIQKIQNKSED